MSDLLERTHCPYCGHAITKKFDPENRLFGATIQCPSQLCIKEFVVNCSRIFDKLTPPIVTVREVITNWKTSGDIEEGQTILSEFV